SRNDFVFDWPRPQEDFTGFVEAMTAHVVLPVSVVGPLQLNLGRYHIDERDGQVVEDGRDVEEVFIPLAHSEGGLSASMQRGIAAAPEGAAGRPPLGHRR